MKLWNNCSLKSSIFLGIFFVLIGLCLFFGSLQYLKTLNIDLIALLAIDVPIFSLFYIFSNNLLGLKSEKKYSLIDIVMIAVFFIFLFIPMLHISDETFSKQENRLLAPYSPFIKKGIINYNYGKMFDKWFNDRFLGRELLLAIHKHILLNTNKYYQTKDAGIYKNQWILNTSQLFSTISDDELQKIFVGVSAYQTFCNEHNIKCYIELVPRTLDFVRSEQFRIIPKEEKDKAQIIADSILKKTNFSIVYPFNAMKEANKYDYVYFKTDHHWTDWGAFIGYKELMKAIKKDFPDLTILKENDYDIYYSNMVRAEFNRVFWEGHSCKLLNLTVKDCPLDTDYKYYKHKREENLKVNIDDLDNKDFYASYAPNKQKVMIIGNSFTENISYFLASSFENVLKRRCTNMYGDDLKLSRWKEEIVSKNIDILIILVESHYSSHLTELKD